MRCANRPARRSAEVAAFLLSILLSPPFVWGQPATEDAEDTTVFESATEAARGVVASGTFRTEGRAAARFDGIAGMERLGPSDRWLVEASVSTDAGSVRLPMKLARRPGGWSVDWMPDRRYERALSETLRGGALPSVSQVPTSLAAWDDLARVPSLPIILRDGQAITPVGTARLSDTPRPPKALQRLVDDWINEVVEGAPGPAGIDVLADDDSSWRHMTAVTYAAAAAGLFRMYIIVEHGAGGLAALQAATPVSGSGRGFDPTSALILGMDAGSTVDAQGQSHRSFRLSLAGELVTPDTPPAPCTDQTALCLQAPTQLADTLRRLLKGAFESPPSVSHVMFAATGDVEVGRALPYFVHVGPSLGVDAGKLFIGYIGESADFTDSTRRPGGRR
jgi:hypothetical protein